METHKYGIECGNVNYTMPMLAMYYYTRGMYTLTISSSSSSSSSSSISSSEGSSANENEDEQEYSHNTGKSGNSFLSEFEVHATSHIDVT